VIRELVTLARGVLTFNSATFATHVESRDALKRGLLLMVVVALLAGLFPFLSNVVGSFRSPEAEIAAAEREFEQRMAQQMQSNPAWQDPQTRRMFQEIFREIFAIARDIGQLKPNVSFLPHWLGRLLQAFGGWLSSPFAWLGAWAWYALWVTLFAKLLGGRATLERMLAATSLFVVPHILALFTGLLDLMGRIPTVGACFGGLSGLIGFVAGVWGIAIYVKATATANGFSLVKATIATALPALLNLLLIIALAIVVVIGIAIAASS